MTFTRKLAFRNKFCISAITLLFTQWTDRQRLKEWLADLATRTLSRGMWWRRHRATVLDGVDTLDPTRSRSNASIQLHSVFNHVARGGWLHDPNMTGFYDIAVQLCTHGLFALPRPNVISDEGPVRQGVLKHWCSSVFTSFLS